eukprot:g78276.t1
MGNSRFLSRVDRFLSHFPSENTPPSANKHWPGEWGLRGTRRKLTSNSCWMVPRRSLGGVISKSMHGSKMVRSFLSYATYLWFHDWYKGRISAGFTFHNLTHADRPVEPLPQLYADPHHSCTRKAVLSENNSMSEFELLWPSDTSLMVVECLDVFVVFCDYSSSYCCFAKGVVYFAFEGLEASIVSILRSRSGLMRYGSSNSWWSFESVWSERGRNDVHRSVVLPLDLHLVSQSSVPAVINRALGLRLIKVSSASATDDCFVVALVVFVFQIVVESVQASRKAEFVALQACVVHSPEQASSVACRRLVFPLEDTIGYDAFRRLPTKEACSVQLTGLQSHPYGDFLPLWVPALCQYDGDLTKSFCKYSFFGRQAETPSSP